MIQIYFAEVSNKEDFQKFLDSLTEAINYINSQQGPTEQRTQEEGEINIDLDF